MRISSIVALLFLALAPAIAARADDAEPAKKSDDAGPKLGEAHVEKWKIGMIVTASGGPVARLSGTCTVPIDWPEQSVKIVEQDLSPGVTLRYTPYGTAKQMVVVIPHIAADKEVHAFLIVEVTRHTLLPPDNTDSLVAPDAKTLPADMKPYLSPSPLIESNHPRIKEIAKQLAQGQAKPWTHVRAIYDWVRKTIQYKEVKHKADEKLDTCVEAIDKGLGDCNQLTSTFIAICRASGIPARTVRIPGHCYPEFYLFDAQGKGHWYPAEASGSDDFGGIRTTKPIMQKGDSFKVAGGKVYRFLPETATGTRSRNGGSPEMKLVCEPME